MTETAAGQTDAATHDPRIGSTLAERYRIVAPLGEGGMGMVYRGVHEALRKPVAIKFLQQKINTNREMVARFEREAVTAANLRHPNIAEAIDYGSLPDGTLYLVMELVEGVPLRKLISPGQGLPVDRVLRIWEQIAAALDMAHSMGIVHRDLKPENILVFDRGPERDVIKIIDFGIARINSEVFKTAATALTAPGSVFGTPQYMAPEQVMGQTVDGRADQYAIGIILFEMLTGSQPYTADSFAALVMQHVGAPIPHSIERAAHVPEAVDAAIFRMMSKLPDERFASVTEALRAVRGDAPPQSLPANSIPKSFATVVMNTTSPPSTTNPSPTTGTDTNMIAFAATMAPGEQFSLPINTPLSMSAATPMPAPMPALQPPSSMSTVPGAAASNANAPSKPPMALKAAIGAIVVLVGIIIVLVVFPSRNGSDSADDATIREDKASGSAPTVSNKSSKASPTVVQTSTFRPATLSKYRLLLKDGKYPFCVTSKLKNAYPVRTNDEGTKICSGTPDGPVPVDSLKPYQPTEFQWE